MIIELDSIKLYFNHKPILNGIYLKVETGNIVGLLGSNGSGKSCLHKILFGALHPKYKLVRIDGKPVMKPLYSLKNTAYLPQHPLTPNHLKIKTLFKILKLDWKNFIDHFENLSSCYNKKFHSISGGERCVIET